MNCYICNKVGTIDDKCIKDPMLVTLFRCGVVRQDSGNIIIKHGCGKPVCSSCYCNCQSL